MCPHQLLPPLCAYRYFGPYDGWDATTRPRLRDNKDGGSSGWDVKYRVPDSRGKVQVVRSFRAVAAALGLVGEAAELPPLPPPPPPPQQQQQQQPPEQHGAAAPAGVPGRAAGAAEGAGAQGVVGSGATTAQQRISRPVLPLPWRRPPRAMDLLQAKRQAMKRCACMKGQGGGQSKRAVPATTAAGRAPYEAMRPPSPRTALD